MGIWGEIKRRVVWFQLYYLIYTLTNVVFVAYYILLAFKQRDSCTYESAKKDGTKVSENVTTTFSVSFIFGFALHTINFTIGTFVEPCVRLVSLEAPRKPDEPRYSNLFMIGFITDFVFRFGFIAFSIA